MKFSDAASALVMAAVSAILPSGGVSGGQEQPARHAVTGTVVNSVTGEAIRRALVTFQGGSATLTDDAGRFTINDVPDGPQVPQCRKPGFFSPEAIGVTSTAPVVIVVRANMEPATLRLVPAAMISGRVLNRAGQPLEGIWIELVSTSIVDGRKAFGLSTGATTNEEGEYEFLTLQPGEYRLRLMLHPVPPADREVTTTARVLPREIYPTQYFSGGTSLATAQVITLQAGGQEHADFTAQASPGYQIRGNVLPAMANTIVSIRDAEGNELPNQFPADDTTGQWISPSLSAGSWTVLALNWTTGTALQTDQQVTINGVDVANVRLTLGNGAPLVIQIQNMPEPDPGVQVTLRPTDPNQRANSYYPTNSAALAPGTKSKTMSFSGVASGHYSVIAHAPEPACVESVRADGVDIARDGITLDAGQGHAPIFVTLREDCAGVQVKVKGLAPGRAGSVLLKPDSPASETMQASTDQSNVAHFGGVSPGNYRVYAFDTINYLEYADSAAMQAFKSTDVSLSANQHADISADLNVREGHTDSSR